MIYSKLLDRYPLISDQVSQATLAPVLAELETVLEQGIPGDIAEFGCYAGTASLFIRRLLDAMGQSGQRRFYAYDSFAGLPEKGTADSSSAGSQFRAGELAVSKKTFLRNFQKAGLSPPLTHKAWFKDLAPTQLPAQLAFAFLDGDFYQSIIDSLQLVWPRLAAGGVITVDDYRREALPGVTTAVEAFCKNRPHTLRSIHHTASIRKL